MKYVVAPGQSVGGILPHSEPLLSGAEVKANMLSASELQRLVSMGVLVATEEGPGADPAPFKGSPISIWMADPDGLKGLSLDQLNVLIRERDPSFSEPYETAEEAIAHLSKDFKPAARKL